MSDSKENIVINCNSISIRYITGDLKSIGLKEYILRKLTKQYEIKEFWANKNITFKLQKGDLLGIIGSNGAGKSTLLKVISGIMVPSQGVLHIKGKVAALLELAKGFDNDLTVRENVFLRGALMGYSKSFMKEMYNQIIAYAELEDFQGHFFKQLSSGMKSRLAFAIACFVKPDILILDEVLSVGDGAFRQKSEQTMREILSNGVTGLFVSHSLQSVRRMCNKILWLDHGQQIAFTDKVQECCDAYEYFLAKKKSPPTPDELTKYAAEFRKQKNLKKT